MHPVASVRFAMNLTIREWHTSTTSWPLRPTAKRARSMMRWAAPIASSWVSKRDLSRWRTVATDVPRCFRQVPRSSVMPGSMMGHPKSEETPGTTDIRTGCLPDSRLERMTSIGFRHVCLKYNRSIWRCRRRHHQSLHRYCRHQAQRGSMEGFPIQVKRQSKIFGNCQRAACKRQKPLNRSATIVRTDASLGLKSWPPLGGETAWAANHDADRIAASVGEWNDKIQRNVVWAGSARCIRLLDLQLHTRH